MSRSGYTDPLIPALFAQFTKNSSSGLVEPHILQDEGHQLLSNTTQSDTTHTADCSSKALDTAPPQESRCLPSTHADSTDRRGEIPHSII